MYTNQLWNSTVGSPACARAVINEKMVCFAQNITNGFFFFMKAGDNKYLLDLITPNRDLKKMIIGLRTSIGFCCSILQVGQKLKNLHILFKIFFSLFYSTLYDLSEKNNIVEDFINNLQTFCLK